jgi:hypothetical protein
MINAFVSFSAAPDALALHSSTTACVANETSSWQPFAFRLIRAVAFIKNQAQLVSEARFANQLQEYAASSAQAAALPWLNVIAHPAPCESVIKALATSQTAAAERASVKLVCSCCCYAAAYAMVCAFFAGYGSNAQFIDVITGSASSCMPLTQSSLQGSNMIACSYAGEFVASTDAMNLFVYR